MSLRGEVRIGSGHSDSIVCNSHEGRPPLANLDSDSSCISIQRIFNEFFHPRCRSLDTLSRRNLINHRIVQTPDFSVLRRPTA